MQAEGAGFAQKSHRSLSQQMITFAMIAGMAAGNQVFPG